LQLVVALTTKHVSENLGEGQLPGCFPDCRPGAHDIGKWDFYLGKRPDLKRTIFQSITNSPGPD